MNICTNCKHHFAIGPYHYCNNNPKIDSVTGAKGHLFCVNKNHDGNCKDFKQIPPIPKRWWNTLLKWF